MSDFYWTPKRDQAALLLAQGYTVKEVSEQINVTERSIYRWKNASKFVEEVDRLSIMTGIASKAERLRVVQRVVRQKIKKEIETSKDILDWIKFAQSETDGVKLDLTPLFENAASLAGSGQERDDSEDKSEDE